MLYQLWVMMLLCIAMRRSRALQPMRRSTTAFATRSSTQLQQRMSSFVLSAKSSLEVEDTDDEYYFRLMQEDDEMNEEDDEEDTKVLVVDNIESSKETDHEQDTRVNEYYLNREAVEQRKLERKQVKRTRRLKTARKMALNALGLDKVPKDSKQRQRYHAAKGVYARLLETLEVRQQEANERARLYVVDREAELAALHLNENEENNKRVGQLDYLKSIERIREQEAKQTRILTDLALSKVLPDNEVTEELSNEDLITVLRVRGNIKGVRRHGKRETLVGLLRRSFQVPLY